MARTKQTARKSVEDDEENVQDVEEDVEDEETEEKPSKKILSFSEAFLGDMEDAYKKLLREKLKALGDHVASSCNISVKKANKALNEFDWGVALPKSGKSKKGMTLAERIATLTKGKYINIDLKGMKEMNFSPQTRVKYDFYPDLKIACQPKSSNLKKALKELNAVGAVPASKAKEQKAEFDKRKEERERKKAEKGASASPKKRASSPKKKPSKEKETPKTKSSKEKKTKGKTEKMPKFFANKFGNLEDPNTGYVFSKKKGCIIGTQSSGGDVEKLTKEEVKDLKAKEWPFEKLTTEEVDESVADEVDDVEAEIEKAEDDDE